MQKMTKEYVLKTLREEPLRKEGESTQFFIMLSQMWEFTLQKEEKAYSPFEYALRGKKIGTHETWERKYASMEAAFLHVVNHLNDNVNIRNKYKSIEEWLSE